MPVRSAVRPREDFREVIAAVGVGWADVAAPHPLPEGSGLNPGAVGGVCGMRAEPGHVACFGLAGMIRTARDPLRIEPPNGASIRDRMNLSSASR